MSIANQAGKTAGKFLNTCVENNSAFLFVALAAGWALASLAHTVSLITSKKIGKKEKKFLVPQEVMDGTFNIATYAAVTIPIMKLAGNWANKKFPTNKQAVEGAKTLATIAGGIISSNIVTPLLRNKTGVMIKNKVEEKNLTMPPVEVYDRKTQPYFKAKQPFTMDGYIRHTKTMTYGGSLKI